ncbi:LAETG motif-containing sortase-dependent surface protein [Streptomyces sp. NPDC000410]|uniref:LAETG motif-containing sortase-dependent surface protein n=1 Tax=Streptomyces sp. NPDC000410 TaxID=3154254 RepID=UPI00331F9016
MSVARRPLLTATAAGSLLCALWFVPSANATADGEAADQTSGASASGPGAASAARRGGPEELRLAETGSVDTTPYLIGGATFLAVGAGFVTFASRRSARTYELQGARTY